MEYAFSNWHRRGYNKAKDEMQKEVDRLKAENKLYAAEMSAAKENGFYSAQELFMAYQNAEEAKRNLFSRDHNNGLQHAIDIIRELKERK